MPGSVLGSFCLERKWDTFLGTTTAQPGMEKKKKKAAVDKTKQDVGGRPDEHCRARALRELGGGREHRTTGETEGRLYAETRASTLCCVHVVREAWLQGKGCAEELWEEEQATKVKCVCWAEGSPDD